MGFSGDGGPQTSKLLVLSASSFSAGDREPRQLTARVVRKRSFGDLLLA
jgi:hypothetical protein